MRGEKNKDIISFSSLGPSLFFVHDKDHFKRVKNLNEVVGDELRAFLSGVVGGKGDVRLIKVVEVPLGYPDGLLDPTINIDDFALNFNLPPAPTPSLFYDFRFIFMFFCSKINLQEMVLRKKLVLKTDSTPPSQVAKEYLAFYSRVASSKKLNNSDCEEVHMASALLFNICYSEDLGTAKVRQQLNFFQIPHNIKNALFPSFFRFVNRYIEKDLFSENFVDEFQMNELYVNLFRYSGRRNKEYPYESDYCVYLGETEDRRNLVVNQVLLGKKQPDPASLFAAAASPSFIKKGGGVGKKRDDGGGGGGKISFQRMTNNHFANVYGAFTFRVIFLNDLIVSKLVSEYILTTRSKGKKPPVFGFFWGAIHVENFRMLLGSFLS